MKTRKEQIWNEACHRYADSKMRNAFVAAAEWADSHPQWIPVEERLPEETEVVLGVREGGTDVEMYRFMDIKEQTKNMSSEDRKNLVKEIIERCVSTEPPIEDSPYIHVVFCKGYNGWVPFTGYGCDISPKKTVEFINCINDAADVLNRKEE